MGVDMPHRTAAPGPPTGGGGDRRRIRRWWWIAAAAAAAGLVGGVLLVWLGRSTTPPIAVSDVVLREGYVANPGMGWQDMDREDPSFAQAVEYVRPSVGWAGMNPAPGVYDWSVIDDAIGEARQRGNLLSLRVYTMRHPEWDGHKVPRWVLDDGAALLDDGQPDYSNAVYQQHWATFVEALRERYDGHPDLAFIDVSGYGNYNEWSWESQTQWEAGWDPGDPAETLDGQARQRLADLFLGGSGTVEARDADGAVVEVDYDYPGFSATQLVMPYAGIRQSLWYALDRRADVGWRYDCLGQISAVDLRGLGDEALSRWRDAPMVYEFCSQVDWSTVDDAIGLTHPVLVHDNDTDDLDRVERTLSTIGYRYVLDDARWTRTAGAGDPIEVAMRWRNAGLARAYPALGVEPRLQLRLVDGGGAVVHTTSVLADVSGWLPGDDHDVEAALTVPEDVPAGDYRVDVGLRNAATDRLLSLPMADAGGDGWLPLGAVAVGDDRQSG